MAFVAVLAGFGSVALARAGRAAPGRDGAGAAAQANAESNVLRATLKNGLRVVVVRDTLAPVVTTVVNYQVGSNEAPAGFPGMAHAQEHMMFRGSPGLNADQLADIAAAMGGDFDADTQQTVTQYFFTVPAEDLDVALHVQSIRMRGVLDSESEWNKERGAIEQEVAQDLSDPEYVFYTKLLETMFRDTPYAHDALGTRPSFNKTTGAMLHAFYQKWYAPNNAILVVAGDVQPQAVLAQVRRLFGGIAPKKLPRRPAVGLKPVSAQALHFPTDLPYGLVVASFRMPGYSDPDYAAAEVLSDVLSSQRGSLYALVPEGKALFAGFEIDGLPSAGLGYAMAAFPPGADSATLLAQVKQVIQKDLKDGLPADLVEAAKRREAAEAEFQRNSISGLAMAWSQALAVEGRHSPQDDVDAIQKVTVSGVNRVARKYLSFDQAVTAILSPQPSGKPISSHGFGGAESFAPSSTKPTPLPLWAKTALARLSVPESTIHPVVSTLPNGLKLIVQPETVSNTVSVYGRVRNNPDLETPAHQKGVSTILDSLFSYGTESLDRLAFQKALDDIAANESAGTGFSVSVLAGHFDRGVQLLADNILHPALPKPAFQTVQRQTAAAIAGELQSPGYLEHRAVAAALFPKSDPSLREATPKSAMSLTLGDVHNYYGRVFRPDLTTIVVIGKVTPQQAREVIAKYFGAWKNVGPPPPTDLPAVPPNKTSTTTVPDKSRVQDTVTLAETVPMTRFSPEYYALELGNHVLGGGFYATRLYKDLREKNGLVYYVGASLDAGRTRTVYSVDYACDPRNVAKARVIIVRDLRQMQMEPVDPAGLRQAKTLLLREIPLSEASVNRIAGGLLSRAIIGLPLDEPTVAARHYLDLNAGQVRKAFAKLIRPNEFAQVVRGPSPQ
ncbi:MAG TPA: pitrilysin family protein [Patescibacteria group bacterium]|nr:pitrilysin family protein [Patescibacteria group bacterium]